jgi:uncharacterized membrane protein (UPF0127 family)
MMNDHLAKTRKNRFRKLNSLLGLIVIFFVSQNFLTNADALKFKIKKITIGATSIEAEIADTNDLREQGLMNRTKMSDSAGMIFVFAKSQVLHFWMKNTLIPLSIGFIDSKGKLMQVLDMEPASPMDLQPPVYNSNKVCLYALEVNKGWFTKHKVKVGDKLKLPL